MIYFSTRGKAPETTLRDAVLHGLAPDGGLYLPASLPRWDPRQWACLRGLSFADLALRMLFPWTQGEIDERELADIVESAFPFPAPLVRLPPPGSADFQSAFQRRSKGFAPDSGMQRAPRLGSAETTGVSKGPSSQAANLSASSAAGQAIYGLELFHGPSASFKDFGARLLARLMAHFTRGQDACRTVLAATSGDTGSAVAMGFQGVPGIRVVLLYPRGQVSDVQEKLLTTLEGNVQALEIEGTFDDCQRMVKRAFQDVEVNARCRLTSANSINVARLAAQTVYYAWAWSALPADAPAPVFSVPSGNFGNLAAGLLAWRVGLPALRFMAATNVNDVVPGYLRTGSYRPRASVSTLSNAMDVGDPSNFERIAHLFGGDVVRLRGILSGASFSDEQTVECMRRTHERCGTVLDPHAAVALLGLRELLREVDGPAGGIFLATAHPGKFPEAVRRAIGHSVPLPESLRGYLSRPKRTTVLPPDFARLRAFLMDQPDR